MEEMSEITGSESNRKSKRVPKKRVKDVISDDDEDEDAEIEYLEKIKNAKIAITNKRFKDTVYNGEEELISEGEPEDKKVNTVNKYSADSALEFKTEPTLTSRQRALLYGKDTPSRSNAIEFPNGIPPRTRKQKNQLTEEEQKLKKAEAAERRRLQVEKAAQELEAKAIMKIRGQESRRQKQLDKNRKRLEELEQEKAANALKLASNTVRWVIGPTGTVVTFPNEIGLPSIFQPSTRSYPPPRENCAGPSCNNPYKYRDSKNKVPLCSLKCYKAVQASDNFSTVLPVPK